MPDFLDPNLGSPSPKEPSSHDDGLRHTQADRPLEQVSEALTSAAKTSESMDAAVKAKQRLDLMSLASKRMSQEQNPRPAKSSSRVWWGMGLFAMAMAAVLIVVALPGLRPTTGPSGALSRIAIPEAHAADAFSMSAESTDTAGVDPNGAFVLKSNVDVNAATIKQHLKIVPAVDFSVQQDTNGAYRITPKGMEPATTYRLSLATTVNLANGATSNRDFSWAFQTKNDFRVISSVPGDGMSGVPANTAIAFKLTQSGWENPASHFTIQPSVTGRFEAHGRTLSFIPDKPLAVGTLYTATLTKGLKLAGSDIALKNDVSVRFETDRAQGRDFNTPLPVTAEFFEVGSASPLVMTVYEYMDGKTAATSSVQVTGYRLTEADAKSLLTKRLQVPDWAYVSRSHFDAYADANKTQVFSLKANLERPEQYGGTILRVPAFERKGFYVLKLEKQDRLPTWVFVQVTDLASYLTADKQSLVVWAVNPTTNKAWNGATVSTDNGSATTDKDGVAKLAAPSFLSSTDPSMNVTQPFQIITLASGDDRAFTVVRQTMRFPMFMNGTNNTDTWSYVYVDRTLYHPQDELKFFGLAQDRNTRKGAGAIQVKIQKEMFLFDDGMGGGKAYQEKDLTTDGSGFYQGSLSWDTLSAGYYRLSVYRDGKMIGLRSFEVREFTKPSYSIEVSTDADRYFAGDTIKGSVRVRFYDGTPVPKASLELTPSSEYLGNAPTQRLVTDENGYATFQVKAFKQDCNIERSYYYCALSNRNTITVRPTEGEEGEIVGAAGVDVYASALLLDARADSEGTQGKVTFTAHHADLTKDGAMGETWAGLPLSGSVVPEYWEPVQVGTYYDYQEQKVFPRYNYELRKDPAIPFTLKTDASGKASYTFAMRSDRTYVVQAQGSDNQSRVVQVFATVAIGWYRDAAFDEYRSWDQSPHLSFTDAKANPYNQYPLNQPIGVQYTLGDSDAFPVAETPGILFITSSRGIRSVDVRHEATARYSLSAETMPNLEIRGIAFYHGHFYSYSLNAQYKYAERALTIDMTPSQASYAPGSTVNVNVLVKTKDGKPAANAMVGFGAVDKALLALTYQNPEDVVGSLYGYVPSGILFETYTHNADGSMSPFAGGGGGAEMGGGDRMMLSSAVRKTFKDTAAFGVVQTDKDGKATLSFQAPDNLTTWRVETVAVTSDLLGGSSKTEIAVTRPVFVDVVAPPRLLATDKPVIKLRAYGTGLPAKSAVVFTVDAPTLGLKEETVTGTAGVPTFVSVDTLPVGLHKVTIGVKGNNQFDAIERTIEIDASRFMKDQTVTVAAAPGTTLPPLGAPEADVVITSQARASIVPLLRDLAYAGNSARVDRKVAARYAQNVLQNEFGIQPDADAVTSTLVSYQSDAGGIHLLPYASDDLELSSEIAATDLSAFDAKSMAPYFWGALDQAADNRSLQIQALSGLASVGEPVLARLQAMADEKDLDWREQLAVARGLAAAGDTERARGILETLLQKGEERDGVLQLAVSGKPDDRYEATADAAALAASLAHPKAEALRKFVETNWSMDVFPVLAKERYVKAVLPQLPSQDVSVSWTVDGTKEETATLKDEPVKYLTLTADEAKAFRVTKANGPANITLLTRVAGRPTSVPEVSISRTYATSKLLDQLQEGDTVRITLTPSWQATAQDGCYAVRDHLPGGWEAIVNLTNTVPNVAYPYDHSNGEVSFVSCKDTVHPNPITYLARVVARGTYTAEAPVMQHLQFASVAAVGKDQTVTVK